MAEPCENCGTPVALFDLHAVATILAGEQAAAGLGGPTFYEQTSRTTPGRIELVQREHTPERCRAFRAANGEGSRGH